MIDTNEFSDDPPTVIDRPRSVQPPVIHSVNLPTIPPGVVNTKMIEIWVAWSPFLENLLGAISIIAFIWIGWLWAWLMEG